MVPFIYGLKVKQWISIVGYKRLSDKAGLSYIYIFFFPRMSKTLLGTRSNVDEGYCQQEGRATPPLLHAPDVRTANRFIGSFIAVQAVPPSSRKSRKFFTHRYIAVLGSPVTIDVTSGMPHILWVS